MRAGAFRTDAFSKRGFLPADEQLKCMGVLINSTEKKKPVEEDRFTYLGLEHLDSGSLKVTRFGTDVAPIG